MQGPADGQAVIRPEGDRLRSQGVSWGAKIHFVQYRQGSGRAAPKRLYTIGKHGSPWTVDTARQEALRVLGLVVGGANPAEEKKLDPAQTVHRLAERFLEIHVAKKKPRTVQTYRALIERLILPALGTARVPDLSAVHIGTLHYKLRQTRVTANRTVTLLSKMLAWGHRNGFPLSGGKIHAGDWRNTPSGHGNGS